MVNANAFSVGDFVEAVNEAKRIIAKQADEIKRLREENERLKEAAMFKEEFLPLEAYHTEEAAVEALDDLAREGQLCDLLDAKQQEIERLREENERLKKEIQSKWKPAFSALQQKDTE